MQLDLLSKMRDAWTIPPARSQGDVGEEGDDCSQPKIELGGASLGGVWQRQRGKLDRARGVIRSAEGERSSIAGSDAPAMMRRRASGGEARGCCCWHARG